MSVFEVFGLIASIILSASAIPQAVQCVATKTTKGLNPVFILTWFSGSLGTGIYMISKFGLDPAIVANYGICITCSAIVLNVYLRESEAKTISEVSEKEVERTAKWLSKEGQFKCFKEKK